MQKRTALSDYWYLKNTLIRHHFILKVNSCTRFYPIGTRSYVHNQEPGCVEFHFFLNVSFNICRGYSELTFQVFSLNIPFVIGTQLSGKN